MVFTMDSKTSRDACRLCSSSGRTQPRGCLRRGDEASLEGQGQWILYLVIEPINKPTDEKRQRFLDETGTGSRIQSREVMDLGPGISPPLGALTLSLSGIQG